MLILLTTFHTLHNYFLVEFNRFSELSRTSGLFPGLSSPGKCHNKFPGLSRFSRTRTNPDKNRELGCLFPDVVIHQINHYPEDSRVCFVNSHLLDSDSSHFTTLSTQWITSQRWYNINSHEMDKCQTICPYRRFCSSSSVKMASLKWCHDEESVLA